MTEPTHQPLPLRDALRVTRRAVGRTVRSEASGGRRGMALLIALIIVAIIGALSVQFSYQTRTNIWMSGNLMASTQAYFNARSAMQIALLAVNARQNFPEMQQYLNLMGSQAAQRLEIWQRACDFVNIFATGRAEFFGMALLDFTGDSAVGGKNAPRATEPAFGCAVSSEDARVNLNRAATPVPVVATAGPGMPGGPGGPGAPGPRPGAPPGGDPAMLAQQQRAAAQLYVQLGGLLQPMVNTGEFASEQEVIDLILAIIDWTDADDARTQIDPNGNFAPGAGSEGDYRRHGYRAKNAKMDTVGEVQLVEGMTSEVYCQIRDKLTVFATDRVNVNDADPLVIKGILCQAIQEDVQRAQICLAPGPNGIPPIDEAIIAMESCRRVKKQVYSTPFTSMGNFLRFFQQFPAAMGTGIPFNINTAVVNQQLGVATRMVRIETEGVYGDTIRRMVAVVDTTTGQIAHFHYE